MKRKVANHLQAVSRRGFLGASSTALAMSVFSAADASKSHSNVRQDKDRSRSDPVQTNPALDAKNPDSNAPPNTDAGSVPTFKYPFSLAHKRLHEGGWSREVTVRELPISKSIAGVNMRLTAGGVRELHWHAAAEWAIMLYGKARITAVDGQGKSFVAHVSEGDLWYFPTGMPALDSRTGT